MSIVILSLVFILLCSYDYFIVLVDGATDMTINPVTCNVGYSRNAKPVKLSYDQINDGYCDCIWTGEDEPLTMACSGYSTWPGTSLYDAESQQQTSHNLSFQCPEQEKLKLSVSKLNDGVCDCCDGADEGTAATACTDQCEEIRKLNLAARASLLDRYTEGRTKRDESLKEFRKFVKQVRADIEVQQMKLDGINTRVIAVQTSISSLKQQYAPQRIKSYLQFAKSVTSSDAATMLRRVLSTFKLNELQWFLVYSCQLAGEIDGTDMDNVKTCIPLRLAGLDYGITWEPTTYKLNMFDPNDSSQLDAFVSYASIVSYNLDQINTYKKVWNAKMIGGTSSSTTSNNRRRLQDEDEYEEYDDTDDDIHEHNDDYNDHHVHEAEEKRQEQIRREEERAKSNLSLMDDISDTPNKDELIAKLTTMSLSQERIVFVTNANKMLEQLQQIEDSVKKDDDTNETSIEGSSDQPEQAESSTKLDPQSITMIRNTLEDRSKLIERGYNFAVSSLVLIDSIFDYFSSNDEAKRQILIDLIVGTIEYSGLSSISVYEILQHTIPELRTTTSNNGSDTCKSPWADLCGGSTQVSIQRGDGIVIPPSQLVDAVTSFCSEKQQAHATAGSSAVCISTDPVAITIDTIPSDIGDGYFGYRLVTERNDDDILNSILPATLIQEDEQFKSRLTDFENELNAIESEEAVIKAKIKELSDSIGGDDNIAASSSNFKFGTDGELHSIRDSCFDIEAGKYMYVLCMFKRAKQQHVDENKDGHGTGLGNWKEASFDTTTGSRIWKWENGDKCWNGPHRSATVYVQCGKEHKVLTAAEPDTCRYVFEMESPIGCDDEFKIRHELS